ncbi:MAG: nicotinic acid mononucleotide adenyltransferase [Flavobacteriaceae bacterium]|nr:nicotinic acid mononucleotide adenyltransferase [Flavobacteriaceae bacterium]
MKKYAIIVAVLFISTSVFAQSDKNVKLEKKGDLTEATYYYDTGTIEQQGTFNADGQLHGVWISYDVDGNKVATGQYVDGKKHGKWFFWSGESLKEVDYVNHKIISVNEWNDKTKVAVQTEKIN